MCCTRLCTHADCAANGFRTSSAAGARVHIYAAYSSTCTRMHSHTYTHTIFSYICICRCDDCALNHIKSKLDMEVTLPEVPVDRLPISCPHCNVNGCAFAAVTALDNLRVYQVRALF